MKSSLYGFRVIWLLVVCLLWGCQEPPLELAVRCETLGDLTPRASVYFEQDRIGRVEKIVSTPGGDFLVKIAIDPEHRSRATENSRFYVSPDPVDDGLAAIVVEQDRTGGTVLDNGAVVKGEVRGLLGQFLARLQQTGTQASRELKKAVRDFKRSFAEGTQKLGSDLEETLDRIEDAFDEMEKSWQSSTANDELQQLQKSVDAFIEDFHRAGSELQDKLRQEVVPELRRQLEALQRSLRDQGRGEDAEQFQEQLNEIKSI